jgi:hypothetical protein
MPPNPTLLGRMYAWLQDEVPATTLEAYRRASLPVFEVMDLAEARRLECATDGLNPWTVPPAIRAEFLCAWNAFVLQTLGNDILDADYDASPATVGYVPPATARQVMAFYGQVEEWLDRARQAHASPDYRLDVEVPAQLPRWPVASPSPREHLVGVLRAMRAVGEHAAAAMSFLPDGTLEDAQQQAQLNRIRQLYASAESKARYALDLHGTGATREVHERVEPYARDAIELFYELGQLVADPSLAVDPAPPVLAAPAALSPAPATRPLPGEPGFDAWCLTDPQAAAVLQRNQRAQRAVKRLWQLDSDPARTLAIHAEIQRAFDRGHITYASDGTERVGYFHCCPWGPVYVVKHPVTLGGTALEVMQRFVYDVGARNRTEEFRRRVLVGNFQETGELQYGPHRP